MPGCAGASTVYAYSLVCAYYSVVYHSKAYVDMVRGPVCASALQGVAVNSCY